MKSKKTFSTSKQLQQIPHFLMLLLFSFTLVTFTGCGSDSSGTGPDPNNNNNNNEPGPNEVSMVGTSFSPANLEVTVGTMVTWTNQSSIGHTVTSGNPGDEDEGELFDSGLLNEGQTFSYTFDEVGEYEYFCRPHSANMQGTITVVEE